MDIALFLVAFASVSATAQEAPRAKIDALIVKVAADQPRQTRLDALKALAAATGPETLRALPALRACWADKDEGIRSAATHALGTVAFLNKLPCPPELVRGLLDPKAEQRGDAFTYVGAFELFADESLPVLVQASSSRDVAVRQIAVMALIGFAAKDKQAMAAIHAAASDPKLVVRNNAHVALWRVTKDFERTVRFRLEVLGAPVVEAKRDDTEETKRERATEGIVRIGSAQMLHDFGKERPADLIDILRRALDDENPHLRAGAARILGTVGQVNPKAVKLLADKAIPAALRERLKDADAAVRREATSALERLGKQVGDHK